MRVLVSVPTFRRELQLNEFLDATVGQLADLDATLVVLDNDEQCSAAEQVALYSEIQPRVIYASASIPGIAAVRNAALDFFREGDWDALVFVDDDEVPDGGWLAALVSYAERSHCGIVTGPVESVFPPDAPDWVVRGGFFERQARPSGSRGWTAATNNTLLKRESWLSAGQPRFDPAFSRTGGSDTDFFARMVAAGEEIQFCAEAIVYEKVPHDRMTRGWLRRRALRTGVVNGIVLARTQSRLRLLSVGLANILYGLITSGVDRVLGRFPVAVHWNRLLYGRGLISSQFGWRVEEYSRG